jgi:hypothetical protein
MTVLLAPYQSGMTGLIHRVAHVVPLPGGVPPTMPDVLTALYGQAALRQAKAESARAARTG